MTKFRSSIRVCLTNWENNDPQITVQLTIAYAKLLLDSKLSPYEYHPVLGWTFENDDYAQNWITLVISAEPNANEISVGNYKDRIK
jgi:hypothetical protein